MTREAFLRKLNRHARRNGLTFEVLRDRGKGAHYDVRVGGRRTIVQSGELSPFHVRRCCGQLGIDPDDL